MNTNAATVQGVFVTGTDTEVGKTWVSAALLAALRARGLSTAAMKPIASGSERDANGDLRNEDALALQGAASVAMPYERVNPYAFEPPIAPHLAAADVGVRMDVASLCAQARRMATEADVVVVEGVGGWAVPLDERQSLHDLAQGLDWPVILVVGLRLGCLNHALLTAEAISHRGLRLAGWVANAIDPDFARLDDNVATLRERLAAPLLGHIPYAPDASPETRARALNLDRLAL